MTSWHFKTVCFLFFMLVTAGAFAQEQDHSSRLNFLFEALKIAPDEVSARTIENDIWQAWMKSGREDVDELMHEAMEARRWYDYEKALRVLTEIIGLAPDFAEGWNQRATVHFLREDYEASLQDIAEVLEREPRHFGALAGRGVIRLRQGKPALAIQNIRMAMKFHPYLRERQLIPQQLKDE